MLAGLTETALPLESCPTAEECTVHVCRSWEELEQFRERWNILLRANPASSIFQTPEWLASWWQSYGQNRNLFALVFADSTGAVVGIAPLYADHTRFWPRPLQPCEWWVRD